MCGWYVFCLVCYAVYHAVSSHRSCCLRLLARRRARTMLPHRRAVRCSPMVSRVSWLIHWSFFLRRRPNTASLVSFGAFLPSFQRFSMDEANANIGEGYCSGSEKFECHTFSNPTICCDRVAVRKTAIRSPIIVRLLTALLLILLITCCACCTWVTG